MEQYIIKLPEVFNYSECIQQLGRSDQELSFSVKDHTIKRLLFLDNQPLLIQISHVDNFLEIDFLNTAPTKEQWLVIQKYIEDWLDLKCDLSAFYQSAQKDPILRELTQQYYGLRMIRIPDLFEALSWAIIGQQINLTFAYKVKHQFIQKYGLKLPFEDRDYFHFPTTAVVANLSIDELKALQFSKQKATYIIGIAQAIENGELQKETIETKNDFEEAEIALTKFKGIGKWSAQYVLMKTFGYKNAFPIQDAGLKNAVRQNYAFDKAPNLEEIAHLSKEWEGWKAYATYYLWRSIMS